MVEVILLAIALSMDSFAVAIGLSANSAKAPLRPLMRLAIYVGALHFFFPLIGYALGALAFHAYLIYLSWLAFILLFFLGAKMVWTAWRNLPQPVSSSEENPAKHEKTLWLVALATSQDALAVGMTLVVFPANFVYSCALFSVFAGGLTALGLIIGRKTGHWLERKAEMLGGLILIGIAIKTLAGVI